MVSWSRIERGYRMSHHILKIGAHYFWCLTLADHRPCWLKWRGVRRCFYVAAGLKCDRVCCRRGWWKGESARILAKTYHLSSATQPHSYICPIILYVTTWAVSHILQLPSLLTSKQLKMDNLNPPNDLQMYDPASFHSQTSSGDNQLQPTQQQLKNVTAEAHTYWHCLTEQAILQHCSGISSHHVNLQSMLNRVPVIPVRSEYTWEGFFVHLQSL